MEYITLISGNRWIKRIYISEKYKIVNTYCVRKHFFNQWTNIMNPLNMKIRSRVDILASILQMANGGAKRSKMTMNNYHLLRHISLLCENDLLQYDKKENVLRTTPKGLEFLTAYNELVECCHREEEVLT